MNQVPRLTSDEWYVYLCLNRYVGVAELSTLTGFSESEIRLHLATLEEQDLITSENQQGIIVYQRTSATAPGSPGLGGTTLSAPEEGEEERPAATGHATEEGGSLAPTTGTGSVAPRTSAEPAAPGKRRLSKADAALLIATVLALVCAVVLVATRNPQVGNESPPGAATDRDDEPAPQSPSTPDDTASDLEPAPEELRLQFSSYSGEPFQSVPIQGTYAGAEAGTALRVQRREDGEWVDFPLSAVVGEDGVFSTFVQLGAGRYQVRVADPESGVVSDEIVLRIG